ncbi:TfdA family Taurine catabolism dioxygenase TauD [Colletotrichum higginsianum]|uniref:TfdA family Taurine catabolism dioxygenase TauD n=2 Tax=Colletotrichum higginsianum TaxID=80884 RepID=H1VK01_COLHI|nr:TfdA family Taurine catabolism dioxygenase TauD [Colletotrichum higginsianum IMI 349063]OBR11399.1 TfdA family Taurine catabolism dioxygenase TauD [Colletotrichum higginsianum IMI 349063]TIC98999.1 Alpha-ketoglutarate-dependent taurine dioxygenase [Colletotrichum higginsianum]CCF40554.1 TfdA family Taurine catabolism dioxygenase TauD [Colletotrichum higginsianum]
MSPSATEAAAAKVEDIKAKVLPAKESQPASGLSAQEEELPEVRTGHKEPLKKSGVLDQFEHFDVTPIIGREYPTVDLKELLRAPNSDDLIRDLAITISQRGVVFFRKQDNIDNDLQKELVQRLGELSGKPSTSKLHIHPVNNSARGDTKDDAISVISSAQAKKLDLHRFLNYTKKQTQKTQWHSDITFEPVPSDYALLRLTQLPKTGGDTLWASGYEVYDRISKPLQRFLDTLTATYAQPGFNAAAEKNGFKLFTEARGAPENVGELLEAVHPVVRTNPVTGWRSIFAAGHHVSRINGLSDEESRHFLDWFVQLIVENHDLQVRYRWQNENDVAIWDNRSVYHAATPDYVTEGLGERKGSRSVSLGERPYFDPQSLSRREALRAEAIVSLKSDSS